MNQEDVIDLAIEPYAENPLLRALAHLFPLGAAADVFLVQTRANAIGRRQDKLFEAIAARRVKLHSKYAQSEPFIHRFLVMAEAAVREAEEEKLELFANLLTNGPTREQIDDSDFKMLFQILSELSARELTLLEMLDHFEASTNESEGQNRLQRANLFWSEFVQRTQSELNIPKDELSGVLARLPRTGCYAEITGGYMDYGGGTGCTTGIYARFKRFVLEWEPPEEAED